MCGIVAGHVIKKRPAKARCERIGGTLIEFNQLRVAGLER